jgi:Transglutaminase-like superfamily
MFLILFLGIPISLCALFVCVARKCGLGGINMVGMAGHVLLSLFRRKQINQNITENNIMNLKHIKNDQFNQNNQNERIRGMLRRIPKKSKIYDFLDVNHSEYKVINRNHEILNEFNDSESDSESDSDDYNDNNDNNYDGYNDYGYNDGERNGKEYENGDKDGIISRELAKIGEYPDSYPFPSRAVHSQSNTQNNNYNHSNYNNNNNNNINIDNNNNINNNNINDINNNNNLMQGEEYYFIDIFNNGRLSPALAHAHTHEAYPRSAKIEIFSRSLRNLCQKHSTVTLITRDIIEKKFLCLYQLRAIQEWEIYQTLLSLKKDKRFYRINKINEKRKKENRYDNMLSDSQEYLMQNVRQNADEKEENNQTSNSENREGNFFIKNNIGKDEETEHEEEGENEKDGNRKGETEESHRKKMQEVAVDDEISLTDDEMAERVRFDLSRILDLYGQYIRLMDMMVTIASDLGE